MRRKQTVHLKILRKYLAIFSLRVWRKRAHHDGDYGEVPSRWLHDLHRRRVETCEDMLRQPWQCTAAASLYCAHPRPRQCSSARTSLEEGKVIEGSQNWLSLYWPHQYQAAACWSPCWYWGPPGVSDRSCTEWGHRPRASRDGWGPGWRLSWQCWGPAAWSCRLRWALSSCSRRGGRWRPWPGGRFGRPPPARRWAPSPAVPGGRSTRSWRGSLS